MRRLVRRLIGRLMRRLMRRLMMRMVGVVRSVAVSVPGLNFLQLSLVIIEPPVFWLLSARLIPTGGGVAASVISRLGAAASQMVQVVVSVSPPPPLILALTSPGRTSVLFSRLSLPLFVYQMVQIVLSLLLVTSGLVKGSDGFVRLPAEFLYEISGDQIARPVQTVGAVDSYQTSLGLSLQDRRVEFLHRGLAGDGAVAFHADLDMSPAKLATVSRSVVAVSVGEVHDVLQLRSSFLQFL